MSQSIARLASRLRIRIESPEAFALIFGRYHRSDIYRGEYRIPPPHAVLSIRRSGIRDFLSHAL